jgi:DNA-binding transcriptional regulator PaaX
VLYKATAARDRGYVDTALDRLIEAGQVESETSDRTVKYRLAKGIS